MQVNKLIKWLEDQNETNNHLFKKYTTFNEYLLNDVCSETIEELISLGYSEDFIRATIAILIEDDKHYPTRKNNKFIGLKHEGNVIKLSYKLTDNQSYRLHERVAKKKLLEYIQQVPNVTGITINRVQGKELREYIFVYTTK